MAKLESRYHPEQIHVISYGYFIFHEECWQDLKRNTEAVQ